MLPIPHPPRFHDFSFKSIGKPPNLLQRFSDVPPSTSEHIMQDDPMSTSDDERTDSSNQVHSTKPLTRPSLWQALAKPSSSSTTAPINPFALASGSGQPSGNSIDTRQSAITLNGTIFNQLSSSSTQEKGKAPALPTDLTTSASLFSSFNSTSPINNQPASNSPLVSMNLAYPSQSPEPSSSFTFSGANSPSALSVPGFRTLEPTNGDNRPPLVTRSYSELRNMMSKLSNHVDALKTQRLSTALVLADNANQQATIVMAEGRRLYDFHKELQATLQRSLTATEALISAAEESKSMAEGAKAEITRISSKENSQQRALEINEVQELLQTCENWIKNRESDEAALRARQQKLRERKAEMAAKNSVSVSGTPGKTLLPPITPVTPVQSQSMFNSPSVSVSAPLASNGPGGRTSTPLNGLPSLPPKPSQPLFFSSPEASEASTSSTPPVGVPELSKEELAKRQLLLRKKLEEKRKSSCEVDESMEEPEMRQHKEARMLTQQQQQQQQQREDHRKAQEANERKAREEQERLKKEKEQREKERKERGEAQKKLEEERERVRQKEKEEARIRQQEKEREETQKKAEAERVRRKEKEKEEAQKKAEEERERARQIAEAEAAARAEAEEKKHREEEAKRRVEAEAEAAAAAAAKAKAEEEKKRFEEIARRKTIAEAKRHKEEEKKKAEDKERKRREEETEEEWTRMSEFMARQKQETEEAARVAQESKRRKQQEEQEKEKQYIAELEAKKAEREGQEQELRETKERERQEAERQEAERQHAEWEQRRNQVQEEKFKLLANRAQELRAQRERSEPSSGIATPFDSSQGVPRQKAQPPHISTSNFANGLYMSPTPSPLEHSPTISDLSQQLPIFPKQVVHSSASQNGFPSSSNQHTSREISLPPVAHLSPSTSPVPSPTVLAFSAHRQSRDAGNVPIVSHPMMSPQAQAFNLRHVVSALHLPPLNIPPVKVEVNHDDSLLLHDSKYDQRTAAPSSSQPENSKSKVQDTHARPSQHSPVNSDISYSSAPYGQQQEQQPSNPPSSAAEVVTHTGRTPQGPRALIHQQQNSQQGSTTMNGHTDDDMGRHECRQAPYSPRPASPLRTDTYNRSPPGRNISPDPHPSLPKRGRPETRTQQWDHYSPSRSRSPPRPNIYWPNYPRGHSPPSIIGRKRSRDHSPISPMVYDYRDHRDYDELARPQRRSPPRRVRRNSPAPHSPPRPPSLALRLAGTESVSVPSRPDLLDRFSDPRNSSNGDSNFSGLPMNARLPPRPGKRGRRSRGGGGGGVGHATLEQRISSGTTLMHRIEDPPRRS